jgi:hypothetical protein
MHSLPTIGGLNRSAHSNPKKSTAALPLPCRIFQALLRSSSCSNSQSFWVFWSVNASVFGCIDVVKVESQPGAAHDDITILSTQLQELEIFKRIQPVIMDANEADSISD